MPGVFPNLINGVVVDLENQATLRLLFSRVAQRYGLLLEGSIKDLFAADMHIQQRLVGIRPRGHDGFTIKSYQLLYLESGTRSACSAS